MFLIDYYINNLAKKGQLLVIDEPELNLHPDNQRKMAALIVRLINSGIKILDGSLTNDSYGMVVKKGNKELLDAINTILEKLKNEGKIDEYIINHTEK